MTEFDMMKKIQFLEMDLERAIKALKTVDLDAHSDLEYPARIGRIKVAARLALIVLDRASA